MSLSIVPMQTEHIADAAALVARRYRALRQWAPDLPACYEQAAVYQPKLSNLASRAPGVAALRGARLVGFLLAYMNPNHRRQRIIFSPEWGNAASGEQAGRLYQDMYTAMARTWVSERYFDHFVSIFAHDRGAARVWQWLNFGYYVIDGVRDLEPVAAEAPQDIYVRRASSADLPAATELSAALWRHMAAPPIFLVRDAPTQEEMRSWLAEPRHALWLAERAGRALAFLQVEPANQDACTIIRDEATASITGAYTLPEVRGSGVASALLNQALAWARAAGYTRCSVDFEAMNVQAARFWPRYFRPVCLSFSRHVNEHILDG